MRRAPFTHSPETAAGSAALPGRWSFLSCLRNVEVWLGFAALLFLVRGMLTFEGALRGDPGGDTIRAVEESEGVLDALQTPFFLGALFSSGACLLVLGLLAARRPRVGAAIRIGRPGRLLHGRSPALGCKLRPGPVGQPVPRRPVGCLPCRGAPRLGVPAGRV